MKILMILLLFKFSVKSFHIKSIGRFAVRNSLLPSLISTDKYDSKSNNIKILKKVRDLMNESDLDAIIGIVLLLLLLLLLLYVYI